MLKRISFLLLTVTAFGILSGLVSATCYARDTYDPYDKVRDLLNEYERKDVDYGESEHDAWEKTRKLRDKYADLIHEALDIVMREEKYKCHLDLQCKKNAQERYEQAKKPIFDALKAMSTVKFAAIRRHYDKDFRAGTFSSGAHILLDENQKCSPELSRRKNTKCSRKSPFCF
jgi:hypothetical protein